MPRLQNHETNVTLHMIRYRTSASITVNLTPWKALPVGTEQLPHVPPFIRDHLARRNRERSHKQSFTPLRDRVLMTEEKLGQDTADLLYLSDTRHRSRGQGIDD